LSAGLRPGLLGSALPDSAAAGSGERTHQDREDIKVFRKGEDRGRKEMKRETKFLTGACYLPLSGLSKRE